MKSKYEKYRQASLISSFSTVFCSGFVIGTFGKFRISAAILLGLSSCMVQFFTSLSKSASKNQE